MASTSQTSVVTTVLLYHFVFASRLTRRVVFVVLGVVLFQPTFVAYAETQATSTTSIAVEDVSPAPAAIEQADDSIAEAPETKEIATSSVDTATVSEPDVATSSVSVSTSTNSISEAADVATTTTASVSTSTTATSTPADTSDSSDSASEVADPTSSTTASSTTEKDDENVELTTTVTTADSFYQFSEADCVRVQDGSFYCGTGSDTTPTDNSFYVALDSDGDREIFVRHNGEDVQLTHNNYDDAAPQYDPVSDSLVWHSLQAGRYQIMSYDFDEEKEVQLTSTRTNHMEPSRQGDYVVWQEWNKNNWDIVLYNGETKQVIEAHPAADIAPSVHEGYIVWKRVHADEQTVVVYDIAADKTIDIAESLPGSVVKNARFMLVYEEVSAAGDAVVRGYDPERQQTVPLHSVPTEMPERIPSSEPTNEVRALVQSKPTPEEKTSLTTSSTTTTDTATATTTSATDLDLTIPTTTATSVASSTSSATTTETAFDLVIPPTATSSEQ